MIELNTKDARLSGRRHAYVVAANGAFLRKENEVFYAVVAVPPDEVGLAPLEERIELRLRKLPFSLVHQAVEFFREVWNRYHTEAFLWLLLDPQTGDVTLACPKQKNSRAHVHAAAPDAGDLLCIGTLHSHPCGAFHSGGDEEDELHSDGLHIVVGNLQEKVPEFAASLVVKGRRQKLNPADVMDLSFGFDDAWLKRINAK